MPTAAELASWCAALGVQPLGPPERLSGGNLNWVYRVRGANGSVILKVAPPHVATQPDVPLDSHRIAFEVEGLRLAGTLLEAGRVPRVLAFDHDLRAALLEDLGPIEHAGSFLSTVKSDAGHALLTQVGACVGRLHSATAGGDWPRLRNDGMQEARHAIQYSQVGRWLREAGVSAPQAREWGSRCAELGRTLQGPGSVVVMGDLWLPSILVGNDRWHLIDWELCHWGQPLQDLAHLEAHLWLHDRDEAPARIEALREGYFSTGPQWDEEQHARAATHRAAEVLARTAGPFAMTTSSESRDHALDLAGQWFTCA